MKNVYLIALLLMFFCASAQAQAPVKGAAILYYDSIPSVPSPLPTNTSGAEIAYSIKLKKLYRLNRQIPAWQEIKSGIDTLYTTNDSLCIAAADSLYCVRLFAQNVAVDQTPFTIIDGGADTTDLQSVLEAIDDLISNNYNGDYIRDDTLSAHSDTLQDLRLAITNLEQNYVPEARTLTINGTTYDLSTDRTWSITLNSLLPTQTGNATKFLQTDGTNANWQSVVIPLAANPTAQIGLTAINGSATTFMRSDAAPALDVGIAPTWTGQHTFNLHPVFVSQFNLSNQTGAMRTPVGTTAQRPTNVPGVMRYNSTDGWFEGGDGTSWLPIGLWSKSGSNIYYTAGKVSAGTTSSTYDFNVQFPSNTSTNGFRVQTSSGSDALLLRGDGRVNYGSSGTNPFFYHTFYSGTTSLGYSQGQLLFFGGAHLIRSDVGTLTLTTNGITNTNVADAIQIGNVYSATPTTGNYRPIQFRVNYAPTSGTATMYILDFSSVVVNQTGGANGVTGGILINPGLISAADFRALEIRNNSGKGVYQTGTSATNAFAGNTIIGATTTPAQTLHVEGTARITGSTGTPTGLMGRSGNGDVGSLTLGTGLSITAGTLNVAGSGLNFLTGNLTQTANRTHDQASYTTTLNNSNTWIFNSASTSNPFFQYTQTSGGNAIRRLQLNFNTTDLNFYNSQSSEQPSIIFRSSLGTVDSPSDVGTSKNLGEMVWRGYEGGTYRYVGGMKMVSTAVGSGVVDGKLSWYNNAFADLMSLTFGSTVNASVFTLNGYGSGRSFATATGIAGFDNSGNVVRVDPSTLGGDGYIVDDLIAGDVDIETDYKLTLTHSNSAFLELQAEQFQMVDASGITATVIGANYITFLLDADGNQININGEGYKSEGLDRHLKIGSGIDDVVLADTDFPSLAWVNTDIATDIASIKAVSTEDHLTGALGTKLVFSVTENETDVLAEALAIDQDGTLKATGYGAGNKDAFDLSKTVSGLAAVFATDGTIIEDTRVGAAAASGGTTDGSGDIVVTHNLGYNPVCPVVSVAGATPYLYTIQARTSTTFTVRFFNAVTGVAAASTSINFYWLAK